MSILSEIKILPRWVRGQFIGLRKNNIYGASKEDYSHMLFSLAYDEYLSAKQGQFNTFPKQIRNEVIESNFCKTFNH